MKKKQTPYTPAPFIGVDWSTSLQRPGCQDHLKCMSLRNGELVKHRPPIINSSNVKVSAAAINEK